MSTLHCQSRFFFLRTVDTTQAYISPSSPKPYQKTETTKLVCYRYDATGTQHCLEIGNCLFDPLKLETRISRSPTIYARFDGWFDPFPSGGTTTHASSIKSYKIKLNDMYVSKDIVKVNTVNKAVFAKTVNATETSLMINISSDKPQLFCVTLEVKDVAGNIRQARRFFLFDNSTYILSESDKPFYVSSASKSTDHTWQTHHNSTCLKWKNHFYNQFYFANKLLNEIEPDPNAMISGIYEQTKGTLPVNGTSNVDGIVKFMVSYPSSSNINRSFRILRRWKFRTYSHSRFVKKITLKTEKPIFLTFELLI